MARDKTDRKKKSRRGSKKDKRRFQGGKLRERLKKGQERSRGRSKNIFIDGVDIKTWRPKDGPHIVDIIPYNAGKYDPLVEKGDDTYGFEYWVHNNVGPNNAWFMCPSEMFNKPCPVCEHRTKLRDEGAKDDVWKPLFPKRRNIYNIICYDRGEEDKGVMIWDVSFHYFEKPIMALSKKPGRGGKKSKDVDFADPYDKGKSINFTIEPAKSKNDYPEFLGHSFDDRDYEIDDDILDAATKIDEIVHRPDYEELEVAFFGEDKPSDEKSDTRRGKKKDKDKKVDLEELVDDVDDMDDMDDLEDFIEEHKLDVKIKSKDDEDDVKEKITEALKEKYGDDSGGGNDDEPTKKDIKKMDYDDLEGLVKEKELDIDMDDFDDDDDDDLKDLRKEVIDELDL